MSAKCQSLPYAPQQTAVLFNHLVSAREQRGRHGHSEYLGGVEVDHYFGFGRLQDRQIASPLALEDAANIDANLTAGIGSAAPKANQITSLCELLHRVDCGQLMTSRKRDNLIFLQCFRVMDCRF
jgi:hypothetical protein